MDAKDLFLLLPEEYEGKEDFEKAVLNLVEGFGAKELGLRETIEAQKEEITALKVANYDAMMKNRNNDSPPEGHPKILGVEDLFDFE